MAKRQAASAKTSGRKPAPGQQPQANGAPPPEAELIAHRSKGFAAMEYAPSEPDPGR